jgi:hypothetical protein
LSCWYCIAIILACSEVGDGGLFEVLGFDGASVPHSFRLLVCCFFYFSPLRIFLKCMFGFAVTKIDFDRIDSGQN